jgi:hypothetical protein
MRNFGGQQSLKGDGGRGLLLGNCVRARRAGNGQNSDGRRGVSGLGGARGEKSMKRAGDAAPHGRSRRAECSRGGVHALKRCSRQ